MRKSIYSGTWAAPFCFCNNFAVRGFARSLWYRVSYEINAQLFQRVLASQELLLFDFWASTEDGDIYDVVVMNADFLHGLDMPVPLKLEQPPSSLLVP
jgi:hypothetical protein